MEWVVAASGLCQMQREVHMSRLYNWVTRGGVRVGTGVPGIKSLTDRPIWPTISSQLLALSRAYSRRSLSAASRCCPGTPFSGDSRAHCSALGPVWAQGLGCLFVVAGRTLSLCWNFFLPQEEKFSVKRLLSFQDKVWRASPATKPVK